MTTHVAVHALTPERYQSLLDASPHSLFITRHWVEAMCDNHSMPVYFEILNADRRLGLLAGLAISGNRLQGRQLYFYSAPALMPNTPENLCHCLKALKHFAKTNGYTRINIRPWDQQQMHLVNICGFHSTKTHEFPIRFDGYDEKKHISSRIWRNIKKAQKQNVTIHRCCSVKALDTLLALLSATQQRRNARLGNDYSPFYLYNLNRDSIQRLLDTQTAVLYCATIDDTVYSVELNVEYNLKAYNVLKASIDDAYQNGISSLIDYHMIQYYHDEGFAYFNLGGELLKDEGQGLSLFKEGLGGQKQVRHGYYTYYLTFPHRLINPLMLAGKMLPDTPAVNWTKKQVSRLLAPASK